MKHAAKRLAPPLPPKRATDKPSGWERRTLERIRAMKLNERTGT